MKIAAATSMVSAQREPAERGIATAASTVADITPPHEHPPNRHHYLVPRSMIAPTLDFNARVAERLADLLGYPIRARRERRKGIG